MPATKKTIASAKKTAPVQKKQPQKKQPQKNKVKEPFSVKFTNWVGSDSSLAAHTIFFAACFVIVLFGFDLDKMLLVLTTAVSLEAIYLAIFIQMTVNRNTQSLKSVEEDIDEIQEDIDEIQEDIDEIQEDVENIQEDVDEIQEDIDEIQEDIDEIQEEDEEEEDEDEKTMKFLQSIEDKLQKMVEDMENLKKTRSTIPKPKSKTE